MKKPAFLEKIPKDIHPFIFHYYRAEVDRETDWRNRLDVTTNWAIGATAAMMSYVFGNPLAHHAIIIVNFCIVLFFLYVEARRFRYYQILRNRTRMLEKELFGELFSNKPKTESSGQGLTFLSESLKHPTVTMSRMDSLAWRLRRTYIFILPVLYVFWLSKVIRSAPSQSSFLEIMEQATFLYIPGSIVVILFFVVNVILFALALYIPKNSEDDDLP